MNNAGLKGWVINFLNNKDICSKEIIRFNKSESGFDFEVETVKGVRFVLVRDVIMPDDSLFSKIVGADVLLVVANSRENLDFLIKFWDKFVVNPLLCVFFVNPDSLRDKKWVVYPHTHNSLIARASLRRGLESLFSGVDGVK